MNDDIILVVDDDKKISNLIDFHLKKRGYSTHCVFRGGGAIDFVRIHRSRLVLLDIRLPDMSGVEVLRELQRIAPETQVMMISAHADVKLAVDCMKLGAYDFIEKPLAFPELDAKVKHVFDHVRLREEVSTLKRELGDKYKYKSIVGKGRAMQKVFQGVDIAAKSDANVLIEGESGTGKELVARAVHFNGLGKEGPFVAVNCGAIPEHLLESELFGHEKGAFTGAIARKIGKFEQAHGGTIFLDEIGDLSASLQVKLVRVLQEREIERVGGNGVIPINARFIVATHRDLKKLVGQGKFREDLYFRINVFPIRIPPLRERQEDIPSLLQYFIRKHHHQKEELRFEHAALKKLIEYDWPGNVRELENFVERLMLIKGNHHVITGADVDSLEIFSSLLPADDGTRYEEHREKVIGETEKVLLEKVLEEAGGNVSRACKLLQISRDTFYRKIKKYAKIV
ncbi:MAG: sigma-54-dependent Fis family transcriptional regulator [Candidatus Omnitrophica bacterium]|nr:sigma-54-dependent Fis family transcriptional regulator [Candidatus Omnitrophota bacterium]